MPYRYNQNPKPQTLIPPGKLVWKSLDYCSWPAACRSVVELRSGRLLRPSWAIVWFAMLSFDSLDKYECPATVVVKVQTSVGRELMSTTAHWRTTSAALPNRRTGFESVLKQETFVRSALRAVSMAAPFASSASNPIPRQTHQSQAAIFFPAAS